MLLMLLSVRAIRSMSSTEKMSKSNFLCYVDHIISYRIAISELYFHNSHLDFSKYLYVKKLEYSLYFV